MVCVRTLAALEMLQAVYVPADDIGCCWRTENRARKMERFWHMMASYYWSADTDGCIAVSVTTRDMYGAGLLDVWTWSRRPC